MLKIEHIAFNVPDPAAMADWYCKNMGMSILLKSDKPNKVRFIGLPKDDSLVLELYSNTAIPFPHYDEVSQVTFHIGYTSTDVRKDSIRLKKAGATLITQTEVLPNGCSVAFLRDPWGLCFQLIQRPTSIK